MTMPSHGTPQDATVSSVAGFDSTVPGRTVRLTEDDAAPRTSTRDVASCCVTHASARVFLGIASLVGRLGPYRARHSL